MARLAACLRDPCELVRRQTLLLFASLLQREYVKWRGPLFHRFLRALVDDSPAVRQLAGFLFKEVLAGATTAQKLLEWRGAEQLEAAIAWSPADRGSEASCLRVVRHLLFTCLHHR